MMSGIQTTLFIITAIWSLTNAQFFYNYEAEPALNAPESSDYDPSQYKYNTPQVVAQNYVQAHHINPEPQTVQHATRRRTRLPKTEIIETADRYESKQYASTQPTVDVRSIELQKIPLHNEENIQYEPEQQISSSPQYQTTYRRRSSRRRQKASRENFRETITLPKQWSPSIFENIGLGQAPQGVYIPEDSLLNILRTDTPRKTPSGPAVLVQYTQPLNQLEDNPLPRRRNIRYEQSQFFVTPPPELEQRHSVNYVSQPHQRYYVQPQQIEVYQRVPAYQSESQYEQPSEQGIQYDEYQEKEKSAPVELQSEITSHVPPKNPGQRVRSHIRYETQRSREPQSSIAHERLSQPDYTMRQNRRNSRGQNRTSVNQVQSTPRKIHQSPVSSVTSPPLARQATTFKPAVLAIATLPDDTDGDEIPGKAGVDYPTLHKIPTTSFSCAQQPYNGYYADLETSCQVVHLCQSGGKQSSFLCPNGTIFNQENFACQWWYKVNCENAPRYYSINNNLYKVPTSTVNKKK